MRSKSLLLVTVLLSFALSACTKRKAEDVPVITELPEFVLVDQDEGPFTRDTMKGDIWVSAFVFTHCRSTCPRLTAHMKGLQARLSDIPSANFVSVSVDPRNDTPEVLKAYMAKNELDERNWRFVTGEEDAIRHVVIEGFKVGMGDEQSVAQGGEEIMHSNAFVLVDPRSRVRGYYRANNDGIADLERDLRAIAAVPNMH